LASFADVQVHTRGRIIVACWDIECSILGLLFMLKLGTSVFCSNLELMFIQAVLALLAAADAAAYICAEGETGKTAHSIATATAEAFALAIATASATCKAQGNTNFTVAAAASAKAAANVWVEAYASAFASAGDCEKCSAYAESYGFVNTEVFLKAVAEAEVKVCTPTTLQRAIHYRLDRRSSIHRAIHYRLDRRSSIHHAVLPLLAIAVMHLSTVLEHSIGQRGVF
jgi:hypothetical protein